MTRAASDARAGALTGGKNASVSKKATAIDPDDRNIGGGHLEKKKKGGGSNRGALSLSRKKPASKKPPGLEVRKKGPRTRGRNSLKRSPAINPTGQRGLEHGKIEKKRRGRGQRRRELKMTCDPSGREFGQTKPRPSGRRKGSEN